MNNYVLYYPSIEFKDYSWLWSASLLYDRVYRIVPDGIIPNDPPNVQVLTETGELGIQIKPDPYLQQTSKEFTELIDSGKSFDATYRPFRTNSYTRLHFDKIERELRDSLIENGKAIVDGDWLHVPKKFGDLYMTYLADNISQRNHLQMLTDETTAWAGATVFKYKGELTQRTDSSKVQQLATLTIRDFTPENILDIRPEDIVRFRENLRDERIRFMEAIQSSAQRISDCKDEGVYQDQIDDIKKEIESALKDYRNSLSAINARTLTGSKVVQFPILTSVAQSILGLNLDPTNLIMISTLGIGLGIINSLLGRSQNIRRLEKESDYSYLIHVDQNLNRYRRLSDINSFTSQMIRTCIDD